MKEIAMTGQCWIVTADNRKATLYSYPKSGQGGLHLQRLRSLEHDEAQLEHERPSLMSGGGPARRGGAGAGAGSGTPHFGSAGLDGHAAEEEHHRFAKELCAWIAEASVAEKPERVSVFVPVRMMAYLRAEFERGGKHAEIGKRVDVHDGELTPLSVNDLAAHPKVVALRVADGHKASV
jgi:hypothetical protein